MDQFHTLENYFVKYFLLNPDKFEVHQMTAGGRESALTPWMRY